MKKSTSKTSSKKQTAIPEKPLKKIPAFRLSSTNQVVLAAIVVLLIFIAAVMSSSPRQTQQQTSDQQAEQPVTTTAGEETRSGQQVARISITRADGQETPETQMAAGNSNMTYSDVPKDVSLAFAAGSRVKFKIDKFQKLAVQPLKFNVYDENGAELVPEYLQYVHDAKMHLIVVSSNLREFNHLMPEYRNGVWNANVNMPTPGTYYAYVEFAPVKGGHTVLRSELTVREASSGTPNYPGLTPNNLAISDGVTAVMNLTYAGIENISTMMFSLTKDGKNVDNVRPYLGAFGHVTVIRHNDLLTLVDTHPLPVSDETKGIFEFGARFMKAGRYTAFPEFKVGDKVIIFPITFDIQ